MADIATPPTKIVRRSDDFRYIPCDAVNIAVGIDGIKMMLGVEELDGSVLDLTGVHLSHKTAMFLKAALTQGLDLYQTETGIKLDEPDLMPMRPEEE